MSPTELNAYLNNAIAAFPGKVSLLMTDLDSGAVLHSHTSDLRVVSASTIKLPILLAALEEVHLGRRSLGEKIAVPPSELLADTEVFERGIGEYTLWELLYWMIVESDNTATNVLIDALGYDCINAYSTGVLGLTNTVCQRKMLDFAAIAAGRNNFTSADDQWQLYHALYHGTILTEKLRATALNILRRQRCMDGLLRYIADPVTVAHKTGGLDHLNHDAGVFEVPGHPYYLGIFTWDGPSLEGDSRQKQFIGKLSKELYTAYL